MTVEIVQRARTQLVLASEIGARIKRARCFRHVDAAALEKHFFMYAAEWRMAWVDDRNGKTVISPWRKTCDSFDVDRALTGPQTEGVQLASVRFIDLHGEAALAAMHRLVSAVGTTCVFCDNEAAPAFDYSMLSCSINWDVQRSHWEYAARAAFDLIGGAAIGAGATKLRALCCRSCASSKYSRSSDDLTLDQLVTIYAAHMLREEARTIKSRRAQ